MFLLVSLAQTKLEREEYVNKPNKQTKKFHSIFHREEEIKEEKKKKKKNLQIPQGCFGVRIVNNDVKQFTDPVTHVKKR